MTGRYSVVVVDDEPLARRRVRQLLSAAPDFDVVAECDDGDAVAATVRAVRPDVVFLDVKMLRVDGFDAQEAIRTLVQHIVFVTAFPEHAARAFDVNALDYLVKPLNQARFNAMLDRVRRTTAARESPRIFLGSGQGGATARLADITWVEADGAYVIVHESGRRHVLRDSLAAMLERLGGADFVRIHRSAVVSVRHVRSVRRVREQGMELLLSDGTRVPVSRRRASEMLARLNAALGARTTAHGAPLTTKVDQ